MYRLVLFDMDGTLLQGRTIFHLAEKLGFTSELEGYINSSLQPFEKTVKIAALLKGVSQDQILSIYREIPFRPHVADLIRSLRSNHCILALATDSYDLVAHDVKQRLNLDYAFANNLLFHDSICTGKVTLHNSTFIKDDITNKTYSISKSTILQQLCDDHHIPLTQSIAVGDGMVDCGMLKKAGLGVAVFAPPKVNACADMVTNDVREILTKING